MKQLQTSLLLTAALSLAAASAYAQAAKSSPGAGASASPPTISSAISRDLYYREGNCPSGRGDAGGQVPFLPGKAEHFRQRLQGVRTFGRQLKHVACTMGAYGAVVIVEAPDDETISAFMLKVGSLGNIKGQTLRAFRRNEMEGILAKIK